MPLASNKLPESPHGFGRLVQPLRNFLQIDLEIFRQGFLISRQLGVADGNGQRITDFLDNMVKQFRCQRHLLSFGQIIPESDQFLFEQALRAQLRVRPGVLKRKPDVYRNSEKKFTVCLCYRALAIEQLKNPDDVAMPVVHRQGKKISGMELKLLVEARFKPGIRVCVRNIENLARRHHGAGNTGPDGKRNLEIADTLRNERVDTVSRPIDDKNRHAFDRHLGTDHVQDDLRDLLQLERRIQQPRRIEHRLQPVNFHS